MSPLLNQTVLLLKVDFITLTQNITSYVPYISVNTTSVVEYMEMHSQRLRGLSELSQVPFFFKIFRKVRGERGRYFRACLQSKQYNGDSIPARAHGCFGFTGNNMPNSTVSTI